jgi:hypothetical protein
MALVRSCSLLLAVATLAAPACGSEAAAEPVRVAEARPMPPPPSLPPPRVISNPGGLRFEPRSDSFPGVVIASSNLEQEPVGGAVYQHWFAEVRNDGPRTLCLVRVAVEIKDAAGGVLVAQDAYVDGPTFQGTAGSVSCLPPGGSGGLYGVERIPAAADLARATRAIYRVSALERPEAEPAKLLPIVESAMVAHTAERATYRALSGTVRTRAGAIEDLRMAVYPIDGRGLIVDRLEARRLEKLPAGQPWTYQTSAYEGPRFARWYQTLEFVDAGRSGAAAKDAELAEAEAAWRARRTVRDTVLSALEAARAAAAAKPAPAAPAPGKRR